LKRIEASSGRKIKDRIILIFGESDNDTHALKHLVAALRPELPRAEPRRHPIILAKGAHERKRDSIAEGIAKLVAAQSVTHEVVSVIAHRDCDAIEPAHTANGKTLLEDMHTRNLPQPIAATPAYEMEAWWFLWPEALAATRPCWNKIKSRGNVGTIRNAKDELRKELRPKGAGASCPDYAESDSRKIAENVNKLNLVYDRRGNSESFMEFVRQIEELRI
jgi:hypothetical protein